MIPCVDKTSLRLLLKNTRAEISDERRKEAAEQLVSVFFPRIASYKNILSFHSLPNEIDTSHLNSILATEKKLFLPRVDGNTLLIHQVDDPLQQLQQSNFCIWEPNPDLCTYSELEKIDCILVPGLGFDRHNQRIGYGKGHYDRLLSRFKELSLTPTIIGLGFKEQLTERIPSEAHDIALDELILI